MGDSRMTDDIGMEGLRLKADNFRFNRISWLYCSKCNWPNDPDSTVCVECGHDLEDAEKVE